MSAQAASIGGRTAGWVVWVAAMPLLSIAAVLPGLQAVSLAALLFPALVACSRFRVDGLVVAFLICESLVHLLKRLIFVFGPQPQAVYFGIQALPAVVVLLLGVVVVKKIRGRKLPWSGRLLAAFLVLAVVSTLLSLGRLPWLMALSAIHQQLLPFTLFFAGLFLTPEKLARVGRTMGILACLSVLYGFLQLAGGPTGLDRAWAAETYSYSIHGGKVFAYLEGATTEFRSYSYYADPLTWGFFLLAGLTGAIVARTLGRMSRVLFTGIAALAAAGLFFSLTRTVWAGLLLTLAGFGLLHWRFFRRPWLVFVLVIGSFAAAVSAGDLLYRELFLARRLPAFQSSILARYATVGTLEARTSAWTALREAILASPVRGQGFGIMHYANRSQEASREYRPLISHNFLVELVFDAGVPGALLFLCFFWLWLREGFQALRHTTNPGLRRFIRWVIAFAAGSMVTGYLNGPSFMTSEWFLMMGVLAGYQRQAPALRKPWPS